MSPAQRYLRDLGIAVAQGNPDARRAYAELRQVDRRIVAAEVAVELARQGRAVTVSAVEAELA